MKFVKACFFNDGDYLMYNSTGGREDSKFIARFKYSKRDRAGFKSFLIKNFTVEEYFAARDAGESPTKTLETKGYVSKTVAIGLVATGYPVTQEGFKAYIRAQVLETYNKARGELLAKYNPVALAAFECSWASYLSL